MVLEEQAGSNVNGSSHHLWVWRLCSWSQVAWSQGISIDAERSSILGLILGVSVEASRESSDQVDMVHSSTTIASGPKKSVQGTMAMQLGCPH